MVESYDGLDPGRQQTVDQLIVVVDTRLVDGAASGRKNTSPGQRKTIEIDLE